MAKLDDFSDAEWDAMSEEQQDALIQADWPAYMAYHITMLFSPIIYAYYWILAVLDDE